MERLTRIVCLFVCLRLGASPPSASAALRPLLGVPYVNDAVEDAGDRWTTFARPEETRPTPGLNCSGFLVAAARRVLGFSGSPAEAARDRLGDSGPGAPSGQDWDFGWDLVLNLSEGHARAWFLPEGNRPVHGENGRNLAGFRVHDAEAWARLKPRWRQDRVYLAAFQRGSGSHLRYHHVALLLKEGAGLGFYQTLPRGKVHRLALDTPEGMERLREMFGHAERILILEAKR